VVWLDAGRADAAARAPQNQLKYVVDEVAGMERRRIRLRSGRTLNADILVVACARADCFRVTGMRLLHACMHAPIFGSPASGAVPSLHFTLMHSFKQCRGGYACTSRCTAAG